MFKKTIPVAVAVVLSLSAGSAIADQTFHTSNDETGTIMHVVPGTKSRVQVESERIASERNEAANNAVTAATWRFVSDETGGEIVQHAYDFRNGKLAHSDKFDHGSPKPTLASIMQGKKSYENLYAGG